MWVGGWILCNRQCLVWFVPAQPTMSLVATVMKMKYFATTYDCTRE